MNDPTATTGQKVAAIGLVVTSFGAAAYGAPGASQALKVFFAQRSSARLTADQTVVSGAIIRGPAGSVTEAELAEAATCTETITLYTHQTSPPIPGRVLSTTTEEALALAAGAERGSGQMYIAKIPKDVFTRLSNAGLIRASTTKMAAGTGTEYEIFGRVSHYVTDYFQPYTGGGK